jgi:hypothetical protein
MIKKSDTLGVKRDLNSSNTKKRHWPKKNVVERLVTLGILKKAMPHGFLRKIIFL